MDMSSISTETGAAEAAGRTGRIVNWVLALLTVPGAIAVVAYAYLQVLGTAACSDQPCPRQGPGELGFGVIEYGAPVVAVVTVALSFFTARRRRGIVVPVVAWLLLIAGAVVLAVSFTPTG
jgi:cytochrome bd-type quinol oxidase subunit 2